MRRTTILAVALAAILATPLAAQARHHHRRVSHHVPWCGIWMSDHIFHRLIPKLALAFNWKDVGSPAAGPAPGVIGVKRHHVFQVIKVVGPNEVLAISGNDNNRVRTRVRTTKGVIAWRVASS